ncbi:MAG: hypothetical protein AAFR96_00165 [Planctomycetota bacterium]
MARTQKRSSKKPGKKKPARSGGQGGGIGAIASLPWRRIAAVTLVLAGVGAVAGGIGIADRRAGALLAEGSETVRITWAEAVTSSGTSTWPPADVQLELDEQAQRIASDEGGPLSIDALGRLGEWITTTGWIDELRSVERTGTGVITIDVAWRAPAGAVRQNGFDYLISTEGLKLDAEWRAGGAALPVILGAERMTAATSVLPGARWPDLPVLKGVELLTLLHAELGVDPILGPGGFDQVAAIDVSRYTRQQRLDIITEMGNRIIWGRAPSDDISDVVPTAQKLRNLAYMRRHPEYGERIDAAQPVLDLSSGPILVDDRPAAGDNVGR